MHPLLTAIRKRDELRDMAIRSWSPYYPIYCRMLDDVLELIRELTRAT